MKKSVLRITVLLMLLALLFNPQLSFQGASGGLLLWFNIVLPTLFPFMICSNLVVSLDAVPLLVKPLAPLLRNLLGLSGYGGYCFLTGLLCGYPIGAKTAADFLREKKIPQNEGNYLLAIANFPSPMFAAGYVFTQMNSDIPVSLIFLALYLPIIPIAAVARHIYNVKNSNPMSFEKNSTDKSFDQLLMDSMEIMAKIGGYIMLFSIVVVFVNTFLPESFTGKSYLLGIIEMTTGIKELSMNFLIPGREAAIVACAAFGGLSGAAQTKTVIKNAGLSIRHYVAWKGLHCILAGLTFLLLESCLLPLFL